jgi:hypothetical protein
MVSNIFSYIQRLEMLVFFSGYPLVYCLVRFLARNAFLKDGRSAQLVSILPFAYALLGTLFLGLQLKNYYPEYTLENIGQRIQQPYLTIWAILSILFWIPAISKRKILSLFHSLIFFLIIVKDLFFQLSGFNSDRNILRNDMQLYAVSVVLNLTIYIFVVVLFFLLPFIKKRLQS